MYQRARTHNCILLFRMLARKKGNITAATRRIPAAYPNVGLEMKTAPAMSAR